MYIDSCGKLCLNESLKVVQVLCSYKVKESVCKCLHETRYLKKKFIQHFMVIMVTGLKTKKVDLV